MADLTPLCTFLASIQGLGHSTAPSIAAHWPGSADGAQQATLHPSTAPDQSYRNVADRSAFQEIDTAILTTHPTRPGGAGTTRDIPDSPYQPPTSPHAFRNGRPGGAALQPASRYPRPHLHQLLAAAQRHGADDPAAALHIAAVATAAAHALQDSALTNCSSSSRSSGGGGNICTWTADGVGSGTNAGCGLPRDAGHAAGGCLPHDAAVWLAGVAADGSVPEPAARAALGALADLLTAALRTFLAAAPDSKAEAETTAGATATAAAKAAADVDVAVPTVYATAAAAARVLYEPRCDALCLAGSAIATLYGRCADAAAVAAAARLLGCSLQLQVKLPPPAPSPSAPRLSAGYPPMDAAAGSLPGSSTAAGPGLDPTPGALRLGVNPAAHRPMGLSEAAGWVPLLELRRHPHPLVRTACLGALQQACVAAAESSCPAAPAPILAAAAAAAAAAPTTPHLLDPAAAAAAYAAAAAALFDDAEEPRAAAVSLVSALAVLVPELPCGTHFGVAARLVDDAFMRLCALVADPLRGLRLQALRALAGLHAASLRVKLQALSKKTTLRVAAPPPSAAGAPAVGAPPGGGGGGGGGGGPGGKAGGKRAAADASGAAAATAGLRAAEGAKRLTTSAWEPQSWIAAAKAAPGRGSGSGSGSGSRSGPGSGSGSGSTPALAPASNNDDLTLLENAVGAFVLGSEDEHWEVRAATLEAMTQLGEYEYQAAATAAVAAATTAVGGATAPGDGGAAGRTAPGGGAASGASTAVKSGLSVRIGGIGGSAGSRIAAGGGNAEAAAAICEGLIDALLDELPEVRQAAARGVGRLVRIEAETRRQLAAAEAAVASAPPLTTATTATMNLRRGLPPLLTEELIRSLAAAARDTDGETRRAAVRALGRLKLVRPALLREVVQALRRCVAANPSAHDWRVAAAAAWRLGAAAPAAAAGIAQELAPPPQQLPPPPPVLPDSDAGTAAAAAAAPPLAAGLRAASVSQQSAVLQRLPADAVLRLLVLAGAHAVQPEVLAPALPPHVPGPLLAAAAGMYRV